MIDDAAMDSKCIWFCCVALAGFLEGIFFEGFLQPTIEDLRIKIGFMYNRFPHETSVKKFLHECLFFGCSKSAVHGTGGGSFCSEFWHPFRRR